MSTRSLALLAVLLAATQAGALPADTRKMLDKADAIEFISLYPSPIAADAKDQGFRGYKPLGKVKLEKKADRERLLKALYKGIDDSDGSVAGCFRPRHGIRAVVGGKTVELVICFECHSMTVYVDGKRSSCLTHPGQAAAFNKILTDAKVPLPKGPK